MIKNAFGDTTLTVEKSSFKRNTTNLWPEFGFFKQQPCDCGTGKENYPESTVFYVNQAYQSYKDNKKVYYADFFIIRQIKYCLNPLENIESYDFKEREAKRYRPRYATVTGQLLGLYETLGYLTMRGDADECFFGLSIFQAVL